MIQMLINIAHKGNGHVNVELMHKGNDICDDERRYRDRIIDGLRENLEKIIGETGGQIVETQHKTQNDQNINRLDAAGQG